MEVENRVNSRKADEIKDRCNKDDVFECLNRIFSRAGRLLKDARSHLSDMMEKTLNYLNKGKKKLLSYIKDGNFDIDNLAVERAIRPFTIDRKNVVLFGSEKGLRDACVYHTYLETCKMRGVPFYEFLVVAFRKLMHVNPDDEKVKAVDFGYMLPGGIDLE